MIYYFLVWFLKENKRSTTFTLSKITEAYNNYTKSKLPRHVIRRRLQPYIVNSRKREDMYYVTDRNDWLIEIDKDVYIVYDPTKHDFSPYYGGRQRKIKVKRYLNTLAGCKRGSNKYIRRLIHKAIGEYVWDNEGYYGKTYSRQGRNVYKIMNKVFAANCIIDKQDKEKEVIFLILKPNQSLEALVRRGYELKEIRADEGRQATIAVIVPDVLPEHYLIIRDNPTIDFYTIKVNLDKIDNRIIQVYYR